MPGCRQGAGLLAALAAGAGAVPAELAASVMGVKRTAVPSLSVPMWPRNWGVAKTR